MTMEGNIRLIQFYNKTFIWQENMVTGALSRLHNIIKQKNIHESLYNSETLWEEYYTYILPELIFPTKIWIF